MAVNPEALAAALEFLRIRDRSRAEVESKLRLQGFESGQVDSVIEHLMRRRMIDDERFAANAVAQSKGLGPARIQARLEKLGINDLDAVVELSDEDQLRSMQELILKRRFSSKDRAKAARFLASRGFDEELIRKAIEAEWGGGDEFDG